MFWKLSACAAACFLFLFASMLPAKAGLELQTIGGDRAVYDDATGYYWMADLSYFSEQNYQAQLEGIAERNAIAYFGRTNWHLATYDEMAELWEYDRYSLVNAFDPTYRYGITDYYYGRYEYIDEATGDHYYTRLLRSGRSSYSYFKDYLTSLHFEDTAQSSAVGAYVVSTSAVPLPGSLALLATGTLIVGGAGKLRRRMNSKEATLEDQG